VEVVPDPGSCTLRKETPASYPCSSTALPEVCSQSPSPYRLDSLGTSLRGRTISATQPSDTIRPANTALHNEPKSAAVE